MSYVTSTDFLALLRQTPNGVRAMQMPGLDYVITALSRAGLFRLWVSQTAPISNQTTTLWLRPALPSWSAEGTVLLWNGLTSRFEQATPELWFNLFSQGAAQYVFQGITAASGEINSDTTLLAVQRVAPAATVLTLPPLGLRNNVPLRIVDFSSSVTNHLITLNPFEIGVTIMRRTSWGLYSTEEQLAGITLHPSTDLNAWVITP